MFIEALFTIAKKIGNNPIMNQLMNEQTKCDILIQ